MTQRYTSESLKAAIKVLEQKQAEEGKLLREQLIVSYRSLNPILLVQDAFKEITTSPKLKESIIETLLGMGSGLLAKRVLIGGTHNRFLRLIGLFIEQGVHNLVSRNLDQIKNALMAIMQRFSGESRPQEKD